MGIRIRTQTLQNSCLHHDHDYHQIVIAYRGGAAFEVQGRGGQVDPFHGCLVPGGDVHFYEGIGDNSHIILDIPTENVGFKVERLFESAQYFDIDSGLRYLLAYMHRENKVWDSYPEAAEGDHHHLFIQPASTHVPQAGSQLPSSWPSRFGCDRRIHSAAH
ncbi:AraC family ligand binding domain-containing protein [Vibrio fluvialis]